MTLPLSHPKTFPNPPSQHDAQKNFQTTRLEYPSYQA